MRQEQPSEERDGCRSDLPAVLRVTQIIDIADSSIAGFRIQRQNHIGDAVDCVIGSDVAVKILRRAAVAGTSQKIIGGNLEEIGQPAQCSQIRRVYVVFVI